MAQSILVIDDDRIDREAVKRYLSRPGQDILFCEAETGHEAIQHLETQKFDCVFLDYNLPDMDGISLLRKFYNADTGLPPSPIVILTGQGSEAVMIDAIRWGAQDYLVKDHMSADSLKIAMAKAQEFFGLKTSQSQAEELLRQSQKMEAVGQLTSGVAHDFNNLLTIILGNTRLIKKQLENSDIENTVQVYIENKVHAVEAATRKGADLVKRLMIFTRQRPLEKENIDINERVRETQELLERTLGKRIEVKTILPDGIWPVEIDVGQFENALINIALNARDAMPDGGRLTIETHNVILDKEYALFHPDIHPGYYVMVAISDTGTGMPPEVASRVFEPFYTTKKAGEGTGLGLSMVYGLVKQSGGYIHVYSEENCGTAFRVYLPKKPEAADYESLYQTHGTLPGGTETILVVEDDNEVRKLAVNILDHLGYNVLQAPNGKTAIELLKRGRQSINLVFTDIVMPGGMSGIELASEIRKYSTAVKVLYTSGFTENAIPDYQRGLDHELIGKPYRAETLAAKIRHVLDKEEI